MRDEWKSVCVYVCMYVRIWLNEEMKNGGSKSPGERGEGRCGSLVYIEPVLYPLTSCLVGSNGIKYQHVQPACESAPLSGNDAYMYIHTLTLFKPGLFLMYLQIEKHMVI